MKVSDKLKEIKKELEKTLIEFANETGISVITLIADVQQEAGTNKPVGYWIKVKIKEI